MGRLVAAGDLGEDERIVDGRERVPGKRARHLVFEDEDVEQSSEEEDEEGAEDDAALDGDQQERLSRAEAALPGWMKNGQVLENWKEVPLEQLGVWLKSDMHRRLIAALPPAPEREGLTLFPVQAAVLPGVIRGVQQVQDLCPIYDGPSFLYSLLLFLTFCSRGRLGSPIQPQAYCSRCRGCPCVRPNGLWQDNGLRSTDCAGARDPCDPTDAGFGPSAIS